MRKLNADKANGKLDAILAEKLDRYAGLAGDGKGKYIYAVINPFLPIDIKVFVTEHFHEAFGGCWRLTDDEFKQLLDDFNVN